MSAGRKTAVSNLFYAGAAVLIVAGTAAGLVELNRRLHWAIFPWTRFEYESSSLEPMEILLGPRPAVSLRIPRAYIKWLPDEEADGTRSSVGIAPPLPLLRADTDKRPAETKNREGGLGGPERKLFFFLENRSPKDLEDSLPGLMEMFRFVFHERTAKFNLYVEYQFEGIPADMRSSTGVQQSLYLPIEDKNSRIICEEGIRPPPGCSLRFSVTERIGAEATIPRTHIDNYDEIERSIRDFVHSLQ